MKGKSKEYNNGRNAYYHLKDFDSTQSSEWKNGYREAQKGEGTLSDIAALAQCKEGE